MAILVANDLPMPFAAGDFVLVCDVISGDIPLYGVKKWSGLTGQADDACPMVYVGGEELLIKRTLQGEITTVADFATLKDQITVGEPEGQRITFKYIDNLVIPPLE